MKFFTSYFQLEKVATLPNGEYAVKCPFPHYDHHGKPYLEENPSAHINPEKHVFHCKVCDRGISETKFIMEKEGLSYKDAVQFLGEMNNPKHKEDAWERFEVILNESNTLLNMVDDLGLWSVKDELRLGSNGHGIQFPVFVYDTLLDVRTYHPDSRPKVLSEAGAKPLILPFDLWLDDERPTLLCAGEKDMAIARAKGFNAITFTGGEMSFPKLFKHSFKGKTVYIAYDNDDTGRKGAAKAAFHLREAGATPYIVTGHYAVCAEKGEDIHDFFQKYRQTPEDLQAHLDNADLFTEEMHNEAKEAVLPTVRLADAFAGQYVDRRLIRSLVTVVSVYDQVFNVPEVVKAKKVAEDGTNDSLEVGDEREWVLDDHNMRDVLTLVDSNITDQKQRSRLLTLLGLLPKEAFIQLKNLSTVPIYKSVITDESESDQEDSLRGEMVAYSIGKPMQAGQKYIITHQPTTHPFSGQQVVTIVKDYEESDARISNFQVTDVHKTLLRDFQVQAGQTLSEKMEELAERAKGFIGAEARQMVTWATDMFYHTPLEFTLGTRTERAYLDAMIVGDPRTTKSQTAKAMQQMYGLGTVVSLKSASEKGLIGGSDNSSGGWRTRIGLLPKSHKNAVIMEEFSGGGKELISKLTEIRSSNRVRITRVSGTMDVPAMVRMLSISNPATGSDGQSLSLSQYPSGIKILTDLIGAAEDIARYDFFLLVEQQDNFVSPLSFFEQEAFSKEHYEARIRWVWSRKKEQVSFERPVAEYLIQRAQDLNARYDLQGFKLFGMEAWKKLGRVAIAVAGMTCSTDESFENIIITKEHIDFAEQFMVQLYDNPIFKLKEFVRIDRQFRECREEDVAALKRIYASHAVMLQQLEMATEIGQQQLQAVSGLETKDFTKVVNALVKSHFIRYHNAKIVPTEKFRKAMVYADSSTPYLKKASEY